MELKGLWCVTAGEVCRISCPAQTSEQRVKPKSIRKPTQSVTACLKDAIGFSQRRSRRWGKIFPHPIKRSAFLRSCPQQFGSKAGSFS